MKIRGHGNAVAIALAGLAVVLAATGTAYAVTATTVNIADPTTPTHVAAVDGLGRLAVGPPLSKINAYSYAFVDSATPITSPTTATLGLTSLAYSNAYNRTYANTDYSVFLDKITVGSSGTCNDPDVTIAFYRADSVPQSQSVSASFPSPIGFYPVGGKKYCIGVTVYSTDSSHSTPYSAVNIGLSAYVISGTYAGIGVAGAATPAIATRPVVRR